MPTTPSLAVNDYFAEVAGLLAKCGPSFFGSEHLTDAMAPPRYTWILASEAWSPDAPKDPATTLGAFDTTFVLHVYGRSFDHAYRLRQALLTALRTSALGTFSVGGAEHPLRDKGAKGYVILQTVSVRIPIPVQSLPELLGADIVDFEPLTAQATTVGSVTPSFDHS
jgi:hypothetical protein